MTDRSTLICTYCNKTYASYKSRWLHIKKYHTKSDVICLPQNDVHVYPDVKMTSKNNNEKSVRSENSICKFCEKVLSDRKSRWKHEQICKKNNSEIETLKNIIYDLKDELIKQRDENKNIMNTMKIHPKTLQKINNQITNNINNGVINIIVPVGKENFNTILSDKQKKEILQGKDKAPIRLTELVYNDPNLQKFRNIYITNMSNDIGYIFDEETQKYIVKRKEYILQKYGWNRRCDIEEFIADLENKMSTESINDLKKIIENYFNDDDYKKKQDKELLITLYNNRFQVENNYNNINEIDNSKNLEL